MALPVDNTENGNPERKPEKAATCQSRVTIFNGPLAGDTAITENTRCWRWSKSECPQSALELNCCVKVCVLIVNRPGSSRRVNAGTLALTVAGLRNGSL